MRERERQTATKPRYYIRGIEITAQTGLGRFGGCGAASAATSPSSCRPPGPRSCQTGTVPKDYPRHFDGLSARPRASVSRRSPRSRAHRGPRAGLWELGAASTRASTSRSAPDTSTSELVDQGREVSAGHVAEDCGSDCGSGVSSWARTPTEVLVPRAPPN